MNCKFCGKEIADDAVFCKFCGKRTDGFKTCPACKKDIDDDSVFCPYCGTNLSPSFNEVAATSVSETLSSATVAKAPADSTNAVKSTGFDIHKVLKIVSCIAVTLVALFALIFIFFTGIKEVMISYGEKQETAIDIFYFFGNAYKTRETTINLLLEFNIYPGEYYEAATLLNCFLGTIISAVCLLSVCVLSVISIVFNVQHIIGKREKNGEQLALAAFAFFVLCASALMALRGVNINQESDSGKVVFNSTTVAGIVLCSVFAFIWFCAKIADIGKKALNTKYLVNGFMALACVVITIIVVSLFTLPALHSETVGESVDARVGVMYLLNILATLFIREVPEEVAVKAWAVFGLTTLSYVLIVGAIVCGGVLIIKGIKNIADGNNNKTLLKSSVLTMCFAVITLILLIVAGEMFFDIMSEETNNSFTYGVPIAAVVLSVAAVVTSIIQKIYGNKTANSCSATASSTVEDCVTEDITETENSQS